MTLNHNYNYKANLFIIGAAKSASSLLYTILSRHEEVNMSIIKEPNFFNTDYKIQNMSSYKSLVFTDIEKEIIKENSIRPRHEAIVRDENLYNKLFDFRPIYKYFGEASVNYFVSKNAATNIYKYNPESKLILILRNPFDRMVSHYKMNIQVGQFKHHDFKSELNINIHTNQKDGNPFDSYLTHSLYYENLQKFYKLFSKDQILIIIQDDDFFKSKKVFKSLSKFLRIPDFNNLSMDKVNESKVNRNKLVAYLNKNSSVKLVFKRLLSKEIKTFLKDKLIYSKKKEKKDNYFQIPLDIKNKINSDIMKLEKLIEKDLSNWYAK